MRVKEIAQFVQILEDPSGIQSHSGVRGRGVKGSGPNEEGVPGFVDAIMLGDLSN
jgi:hypothetical protein